MPSCFVVMGFGKKTDYPTGRVLDLDKSYQYIIKHAATAAGYDCVRADEIQHSGNINVPMYQQLFNADVVIADISTNNPNALYELGVRHALKPFTTITIAEDKIVYPFDVAQIAIRKYRHLGDGIDYGEVERMRKELAEAIKIVGAKAQNDSPVYTFLTELQPPVLGKMRAVTEAYEAPASQPTIRALMDQAEACLNRNEFATAKGIFAVVQTMMPLDSYVAQRLALATYKSKSPTPEAALNDAAAILKTLKPTTSTDAETLGLYGSVHKRLWDITNAAAHLDTAIWAHEKAFYVRNDYYNGINFAFLLNCRAALTKNTDPAGAIADFVIARRIRRRVLDLCQALIDADPGSARPDLYWITATMAEARLGLGDEARSNELIAKAKALPNVVPWMIQSTEEQLAKLRPLLAGPYPIEIP